MLMSSSKWKSYWLVSRDVVANNIKNTFAFPTLPLSMKLSIYKTDNQGMTCRSIRRISLCSTTAEVSISEQ